MKRSLTDSNVTYRLPQPGELKDRLSFRTRQDVPMAGGGTQPIYTEQFKLWGRVRQISGSAYLHSKQIGEDITHTIIIRRRDDITTDMEVLHDSAIYRVMRVSSINDGRRFTRIDAKELGADIAVDELSTFYGGYGGNV